jgi:hypothetical protein
MFFLDESHIKINIKKVRFEKIVNVILVPSRKEYIGICDDLWWKQYDFEKNRNLMRFEILTVAHLHNKSFKEASEIIYSQSIE